MRNVLFLRPSEAGVACNHPMIAIVHGQEGYRGIYTESTPDQLNQGHVSARIVQSAIAASILGWSTKAAIAANAFFLTRQGPHLPVS